MKNNFVITRDNETLSFELSKFDKIDAQKYTLYDVLADSKLDHFTIGERLLIFNSWLEDMDLHELTYYHRYATNGCDVNRSILNPFTGKVTSMLNFSSNDYLNMSQHPRVIDAGINALKQYGAGAGASCNATGQTQVKQDLEDEIAHTFGYGKALVFASGYTTNTGVLGGLLRTNDVAIVDMYAHASIMDGLKNHKKMLFKHNDMKSLESVLSRVNKQYTNKIVIVDGVYSMDGDIANIPEISALCKKYKAFLMVDEAHAFGVIGKNGLGVLDHFEMPADSIDILVGTFSKAIGSAGGFVTGKKELINYLELASRSYMFSTAPFIASNAAALESIRIIKQDKDRRNKLWNNINYFRTNLKQGGFNISNSETAIFPIIIGNHNKVVEMTKLMSENQVLVNGIPYPVVPRRLTRVRMTVTAEMTITQLNKGYVELFNAANGYKNNESITLLKEDGKGVKEYQKKISNERQTILTGSIPIRIAK
jgi:glycine C-acetyltransferase